MTTAESTVAAFVQALGGARPTPASGSGAAVAGAIGAGLTELAARVSGDEETAARLHALATRLLELADEDAEAYSAFMATRSAEARRRTIDVPLAIAEAAAAVRALAAELVPRVKQSVVGDAEAGGELAAAAERVGRRLAELNMP
jgi:formiminotetrahydrofolate cyclodeaminase